MRNGPGFGFGNRPAGMPGWEYRCPECDARVSSGFADPWCPMAGCGALMDILSGPSVPRQAIADVIAEAENLLLPD